MEHTTPQLEPQAIHIWQVDLLAYACHPAWLNAQEKQRLAKFRNSQTANAFCATRSALRYLLGQYMQLAPTDVPLLIGQQGKPYVENSRLQFNLSHSGRFALLAFSHCAAIGVDVEFPRPIKNIQAIAQRTLDLASQQSLAGENYTAEAFFRHWVRFEAKQKCMGQGVFGKTGHAVAYHEGTLANGGYFCVAWHKACDNPALHFFELS